jgi:hypothetical protein
MTNLEKACRALGWSGGTIHQVSKVTKLIKEQILNAEDIGNLVLLIEAHGVLSKNPRKNKSLIARLSNEINGKAWLSLNK